MRNQPDLGATPPTEPAAATPQRPALPPARDKLLFTPGPLTTSLTVRRAMLSDAGSWHTDFNALVATVRRDLLRLAGLTPADRYECIPLQGSGTFGVEAVFATCVPPQGRVLVLANGAYGERMLQMLRHARIDHDVLRTPEHVPPDPADLARRLAEDPRITHVAAVHCETTTGILNPVETLAEVTRAYGRLCIVDAMSSFGAIPIEIAGRGIDYLVSSANKCIEGVPGFSFVIARREPLLACEGFARSLSLDLLGQLKGFEKNGQFRYTPPTHSMLAFRQALDELELEGGITRRQARYRRNQEVLSAGMRRLGFKPYLPPEVQSCIITAFRHPQDRPFHFTEFYHALSERGYIIYPGKISQEETFRIGSIGRICEADIRGLLAAIADICPPPAADTPR